MPGGASGSVHIVAAVTGIDSIFNAEKPRRAEATEAPGGRQRRQRRTTWPGAHAERARPRGRDGTANETHLLVRLLALAAFARGGTVQVVRALQLGGPAPSGVETSRRCLEGAHGASPEGEAAEHRPQHRHEGGGPEVRNSSREKSSGGSCSR